MHKREWPPRRGRRAAAAVVVAGVMALGIAACGGSGDSGSGASAKGGAEPYVVGASADISGPIAATYGPILEGLRVYTDWLNGQGGVDGHPIKLLVRDHKSDPALVSSDVKYFNESGTTAVMFAGPSSTLASYVAAMKDAPTIYGNSCYPPSPPPKPAANFFCVGVSPATDAVALVELLFENMKGKDVKLGLVAEDIPGCRVVNDKSIAPLAKKRGAEVVASEVVPVDVTNMRPTAEKLRAAGANAIIQYCLSAQMVGLGDALGEIGWDGLYMAAGNIPGMIAGVEKSKAPSFYVFDWFGVPDDTVPVFQDISQGAEKYGAKSPIADLRWGWAIGLTLTKALKQCGFPCSREKLTQTMNGLRMDDAKFLQLFLSPLQWSPGNHTTPAKAFQLERWDDAKGGITTVMDKPLDIDEVGMGG